MPVNLRGPIDKEKAAKKFGNGQFTDLLKHDNIVKINQIVNDYACNVICRIVPFTKEGNVEVTPIGVMFKSDEDVKGEIQTYQVQIKRVDCLGIYDIDDENQTMELLGFQAETPLLHQFLDQGAVKRQLSKQI